jgi:DNA-binding transcriptional LysR family regulator
MENFRLKVFRTVADEASFRRAAERLHLSQPAVSQQIHALEEELSTTLFDRGKGRIRLTESGVILLRYARKGARLAEEALAALASFSSSILASSSPSRAPTLRILLQPSRKGKSTWV